MYMIEGDARVIDNLTSGARWCPSNSTTTLIRRATQATILRGTGGGFSNTVTTKSLKSSKIIKKSETHQRGSIRKRSVKTTFKDGVLHTARREQEADQDFRRAEITSIEKTRGCRASEAAKQKADEQPAQQRQAEHEQEGH